MSKTVEMLKKYLLITDSEQERKDIEQIIKSEEIFEERLKAFL